MGYYILHGSGRGLPPFPTLDHTELYTSLLRVTPDRRVLMRLADLGCQAIEAADAASSLRVLESDARIDLLITASVSPAA